MERRPLAFESLAQSLAEVHQLRDSGYAAVGKWNLGMICQHLTKTMRMSLDGLPFVLPFFLRPIARWMLFDSVMKGRPTKLKFSANAQFLPDDGAELEQSIAEFEETIGRVMADSAPLQEMHPVFGKVSKDEWRTFHAWHAAHHLSFLLPKETTPEAVGAADDERNAT